ncbi:ABC transporter substrate-binding protein [Robinsoniella sp. KNHs210]|uniref:ABC transporter substrate-binding protein n=1 Tax=Robinsoniella sp. KNHs210 TaxID=1469950 RepID=UPI000485C0BC|nr:ABC transporter substrate-binding protein [Robinsoniella sp. KNHs210]
MKTILKKVLALSMAGAVVISTLTGCVNGKSDNSGDGSNDTKTSAMGRYQEEEMKLPEGLSQIMSMSKLADGGVRILANNEKNKPGIWDSKDNGSTWTKVKDLTGDIVKSDSRIIASAVSATGESAVVLIGEINETGEVPINYWIIDKDGNTSELPINLPQSVQNNPTEGKNGEMQADSYANRIVEVSYTDSGKLLGLDQENTIHLFDSKTGEITKKFSVVAKENYIISYQAIGDVLIVATDKEVQLFNLSTGEQMEKEVALNDQIFKGKDESDIMQMLSIEGSPFLFAKGKDDKSVFFGSKDGMYSYSIGGNVIEQVINGSLTSMGNPKFSFVSIIALEDGSFLVAGTDGFDTYKLYKYTYSKDTPTIPSKGVQVYSLEDNVEIRQAIVLFQNKNPDIYVTLEIGRSGDDAVTDSDALRTLNTNIMAGKGPDVLILDGMPINSYMEKGLLKDLTEILKQEENSGDFIESIKKTYLNGDKIQAIPTRFKVPLIQGSKGDIDDINDLTSLTDQMEKLKKENPDMGIFGDLDFEELFEKLYVSNSAAWIKEDGTLNQEAVQDFFTKLKRIYGSDTHETKTENSAAALTAAGDGVKPSLNGIDGGIANLIGKKNLMNIGLLGDFTQYTRVVSSNRALKDGAVKLLNGQSSNTFVPMSTVGISNKSSDVETAGKFISFLLSKEAQKINQGGGLPVNREAFDEGIKEGTVVLPEKIPYIDANGRQKDYKTEQPSKEDIKYLNDMIDSLTTPSVEDAVIKDNIKEQAEQCVSGQITIEEAVKNVMQKVNLYLSE